MRTKLDKEELLIFEARKHWYSLLRPAIPVVMAILFEYYVRRHVPFMMSIPSFIGMSFLSVSMIYFAYSFLDRQFNIWAVTTNRLLDEWGVLSRNCVQTEIDKITNVEYYQSVLGQLLGYGTVVVRTASDSGVQIIRDVDKPAILTDAIRSVHQSIFHADELEGQFEYRICPYCAETIKSAALVCRFCHRDLPPIGQAVWRPTEDSIAGADIR